MDTNDSPRRPQRWAYAVIPVGILLMYTVTWPLRNIALVYWVRGSSAYHEGVRVLGGKPTRFSDGPLAPNLPNFVTGLLAFVVAMSAAFAISWLVYRAYEKFCSRRAA